MSCWSFLGKISEALNWTTVLFPFRCCNAADRFRCLSICSFFLGELAVWINQ